MFVLIGSGEYGISGVRVHGLNGFNNVRNDKKIDIYWIGSLWLRL